MHRTSTLILLLGTCLPLRADTLQVNKQEQRAVHRWIARKFSGRSLRAAPQPYLTTKFKDQMLKNMATTKVYHSSVGSLPLKINKKTYRKGIYCPSPGKITVHLPTPGHRFRAVFGVDSNRVESFYSNAGQGRVVGHVIVNGKTKVKTKVCREGTEGIPIDVDLEGAKQFTLVVEGLPAGIVERVSFNQADWADALVELENGKKAFLGDMPTAPLRAELSKEVPFSFRYNQVESGKFLNNWQRQFTTKQLSRTKRQYTLTLRDPKTKLQVRCVAVAYRNSPVVEWTLYFKNGGKRPTPIIEDILPLDLKMQRDNEGEFVLHHSNGSPHSLVKMSDPTDYAPRRTKLRPGQVKTLGSRIGLPASNDLPMFNIDSVGQGMIVAIGWPGQWEAKLTRDKGRGLHIQAGQQGTHFRLMPGEEVRSPLIALLFWHGGDWLRAQNLWRRWMVADNLPRTGDGKLPPPQHAASSSAFYMEMTAGTEKNQRMFIDRYIQEGLKPDYWWIDAGWYEYKDYWLNVGTWKPNKKRFPRGLRPISNHLHNNKMKMILWFTAEAVTRGSYIDQAHPEWLLKGGGEWWMGHALIQGEFPAHVNDSGLTMMEDVAAFGTGNPDATVTGRKRLTDGKWHLVTATRTIERQKKRSILRLYVDGKLDSVAISRNTEPMDRNDSFGVGRQYQTRGIKGDIDDVRTYAVALSAAEVKRLFQRKSKVRPYTHYTFDGSLKDSAKALHGTKIGSGNLKFVAGSSQRANDKALRFNNNYGVKIPNKVHNNYTLSCWVRLNGAQPPPYGRGDFRLMHFGIPAARKWMTNHIEQQLKQQGADLYRHDGIPPLKFWRSNDALDRQGITEIKHIEGLLAYWDELRRRNPMLRIDICSGGGSRNELETLRRAVPLWRSDYAYETTGMQTLTYGMSLWIPYFGTGINASDSYTFRSQMAPANSTSWDLRRKRNYQFHRAMLAQRRKVTDCYFGDFYPLTTYRTTNDVWMAWQFHRKDQGMLQAFRRPNSKALAMRFRLRGLDPKATYEVQNLDAKKTAHYTGKQLQEHGLIIELPKPRSAALIHYRR